jgi:hypothetical protein
MKKGFPPTLEMDHSGLGKGGFQFSEGFQGKILAGPEISIGRARAIDAGCLTV